MLYLLELLADLVLTALGLSVEIETLLLLLVEDVHLLLDLALLKLLSHRGDLLLERVAGVEQLLTGQFLGGHLLLVLGNLEVAAGQLILLQFVLLLELDCVLSLVLENVLLVLDLSLQLLYHA